MSFGADGPQGPGWWQASDGKWYAPQGPPVPPPPSQPPLSQPQPSYQQPQYQQPQYQQPQYQQPQAPFPAAQAPKSSGGNGCLKAFLIALAVGVVLLVLLFAGIFFAARKVVDKVGEAFRPLSQKEAPVAQNSCLVNASQYGEATGTVTNNTGEPRSLSVTVEFVAGGAKIGTGSTTTQTLTNGETGNWTIGSVNTVPAGSALKCTVVVRKSFFDDSSVSTQTIPVPVPTT